MASLNQLFPKPMSSRFIPSIIAIFVMAFTLQAQSLPPRPTEKLILLSPGAAWKLGAAWANQAGIDAHAAYYNQALSDGKISGFGPRADGQGAVVSPSPSLSASEARSLAMQDPAVKNGLLKVDLIEWVATAGQASIPAVRSFPQAQPEAEKEKKSFLRSSGKSAAGRARPPAFE